MEAKEATPDLQASAQQIQTWFADHQSELFEVLGKFVGMDTFTHDGAMVDAMGKEVRAIMESWGFACQTLPHAPIPEDEPWMESLGHVVVAKTHPDCPDPGVVFMGHMDTVFPAGAVAARPFTLDLGADRATGPGILDMKSGLVINMFAARALRELGLIDVPMTLSFTPDEELGSPNSSWHTARVCNGAHAALCTEPGYLEGGVSVERKGSGHMLLEIQGISSHAGRDYEKGSSAILELAHKILAYNELLDLEAGTTVNTGIISGGNSANSVAPWAKARVHLTFRTFEQGKKLVQAIRDETDKVCVPGTKSHISGGMRLPPLESSDKVMKLYNLISQSAAAINYPCRLERSKGAAESGICYSLLDLPVVCSMGPEGTGLHAPEEYIIPSTVLPRAEILALTAMQAARAFTPSPKVALD